MNYNKYNNVKDTFIPRNSEKYTGTYPIVVRSTWERMFMQWLDANPNVIEWKSESTYIKYFDPVYNRWRRYYPDFLICLRDNNGNIQRHLIEIKPYKETVPPRFGKGDSQRTKMIKEANYKRNKAKFKAAIEYCRQMGYGWKILTERELFTNGT